MSLASGYCNLQLEFLCSVLAVLGEWNGCFWLLPSLSIYCEDESCMGVCIGPYVGKTLDHFQYAESLGVAISKLWKVWYCW